ncbi:alanine--glyoxylate aminotransferase family protein [SAR202 cluster bacterium AD-804-J14_MRT_500m]|nr:alanine--glyoxylate aminotransferase family protein [SAR202 cluster bacterium AD-804-J14_MRT_500m]
MFLHSIMTQKLYPELDISDRVLLSTGPTNVHSRVLKALSTPVIGYSEPEFFPVVDGIAGMLGELFQSYGALNMALPTTGSGGIEAGIASLVERGDTVVIGSYGFFCDRMIEIAKRQGANVHVVEGEWGKSLNPQAIKEELKKHKSVKLVGLVQAETSTGIAQPLDEISKLVKDHDALLMVDAVTSLGGSEVGFDTIGMDYCFSASQKCLGCPPGLAPVAISEVAMQVIKNRKQPPQTWYLDLSLIAEYWSAARTYHHTIPASMFYALYEGLRVILEEGLDNRFKRHRGIASALCDGLEAMGLQIISDPKSRLPQITPVWAPDGVDERRVRQRLVDEYGIEISRGLGKFSGKAWRVGLMGEACRPQNVISLLSALETILPSEGYEAPIGAGIAAAQESLDRV